MNNQRIAGTDAVSLSYWYSLQFLQTSVKYSFVLYLHLMSSHARISMRQNTAGVKLPVTCYFKRSKTLFYSV